MIELSLDEEQLLRDCERERNSLGFQKAWSYLSLSFVPWQLKACIIIFTIVSFLILTITVNLLFTENTKVYSYTNFESCS